MFPRPLHFAVVALLLCRVAPLDAQAANRWQAALRQVRLLPPSAFPRLPATVRSDLERRRCGIPQVLDVAKPNNVVSGSFARAGQTDWAVLCSVSDTSTILVYWGGPARCPPLDSATANLHWLQEVGGGRIGFSRALGAVDRAFILQHFERYGGVRPPRIDHQGIDDRFVEKASQVRYCDRGRWLALAGAD